MVDGSGLLERTKTKWPCGLRWRSAMWICERERMVRAARGAVFSLCPGSRDSVVCWSLCRGRRYDQPMSGRASHSRAVSPVDARRHDEVELAHASRLDLVLNLLELGNVAVPHGIVSRREGDHGQAGHLGREGDAQALGLGVVRRHPIMQGVGEGVSSTTADNRTITRPTTC